MPFKTYIVLNICVQAIWFGNYDELKHSESNKRQRDDSIGGETKSKNKIVDDLVARYYQYV